jgi:hypothetical protein
VAGSGITAPGGVGGIRCLLPTTMAGVSSPGIAVTSFKSRPVRLPISQRSMSAAWRSTESAAAPAVTTTALVRSTIRERVLSMSPRILSAA